ncbi:hypothetical protein ACIBCM_28880 [Streptomyces sp. NPDC051018]|uniref:hypothetical protein n=1 Tax=Streptomyces sp. NPDC051018 TaxID=3365639 RepID=UPI0037B8ABC7
MGSLRNPIGPLPSSIYWRRRAVALTLAALMVALAAWALASGGGGDDKGDGANGAAKPAPSITPGPSQSGPAISEQPGGREDGGTGTGPGDGGSGSSGTDGGAAAGTGSEASGGGHGSGGTGAGAGGTVARQLPADSSLPNCPSSTLKVELESVKTAYKPGEKPMFRLIATNSSATTCKADFRPKEAVLSVTDSGADEVWSSEHCPSGTERGLVEVPAHATITYSVPWDRSRSEPGCASPRAGAATAGTYLVEASVSGVTVDQATFRLEKD